MNEVNIEKFIQQTEEYLRVNHQHLSKKDLKSITELYEDLNNQLARQQLYDDLYQ